MSTVVKIVTTIACVLFFLMFAHTTQEKGSNKGRAEAFAEVYVEKITGTKPLSSLAKHCPEQGPTGCQGREYLVRVYLPTKDNAPAEEIIEVYASDNGDSTLKDESKIKGETQ